MGLFKDFGTLIGEIAEATGECLDDLTVTAAGTVKDVVNGNILYDDDEYIVVKRKKKKKVIIIEDDPSIFDIISAFDDRRKW